MKISKSDFKLLVKECLVELLADGLGGNLNEGLRRNTIRHNRPSGRSVQKSKQLPSNTNEDSLEPQLRAAINEVSNGNTDLASILADTAATTMRKQAEAESQGGRQAYQPQGFIESTSYESSVDEMFGDDISSKWAALAFANTDSKN